MKFISRIQYHSNSMFYGYSKKKNYYVIISSIIIPFNSFYDVLSVDLRNKKFGIERKLKKFLRITFTKDYFIIVNNRDEI